MKIALIGHGKMGRLVDELAPGAGLEVTERFDSRHPITAGDYRVAIDFTVPSAVLGNVRRAAQLGVNLVIGTTGWDADLDAVRSAIGVAKIGAVHGANFSIGVNLFYQTAKQVAEMLVKYPEYDPYVLEMHHRHKRDAPSGTAKRLQKILGEEYSREIPASSVRAGEVPGTHTVGFESEADSITLTHTARSRKGFALGAIMAAKWIEGRTGLYSFEEILWEAPR